MSKKDTLFKRINEYLGERKLSTGGYAPVTDQEMTQLDDIIRRLTELKYQEDPDGDLPVEFVLTDRTRFERPYVRHIRYSHEPVDGLSELELHQLAADAHSSLAASAMDSAQRHMTSAKMILEQTVSKQKPLTLRGQRYVVLPPEGLTAEVAVETLKKLVVAAYKKEPAPVDYHARESWMASIAKAASQKLGVVVEPGHCIHTTEGVRTTFDVPVFNGSLRVTSNPNTAKPEGTS